MLFRAGPKEDPDHRQFGNLRQPGSVGFRNPPDGNQDGRGLPHGVKDFQEGTKQVFRSHLRGRRSDPLPAGEARARRENKEVDSFKGALQ